MDNYLNLGNLFFFIRLRAFLAVQELCVGKESKLDKIWEPTENPRLFNLPPHNVHNLPP